MRFKVDLGHWQDLLHAWIQHDRERSGPFDRRFKYTKLSYNDTRDMIVNILWNECHRKVKYKYDPWDVDHEIDKWFKDYYPYPGVTSNGTVRDAESIQLSDIIERLEARIAEYVRTHSIHTRWHIYELFNDRREVFILEMYGDWRAREYCKIQGMEYEA